MVSIALQDKTTKEGVLMKEFVQDIEDLTIKNDRFSPGKRS